MEENPSFESAHVTKKFLVLIVPCGKHILTLTSLLHNPIHSTSSLHISLTSILVLSSTSFTQWHSSLRHCATRRNVAALIPDGSQWNFSLSLSLRTQTLRRNE